MGSIPTTTEITHEIPKRVTSRPTGFEEKLMEQFEPLSDDPVENMAGFIVRGVVDIARYRRTVREVPEKVDHYLRLQRCTQTAMQVRFASFVEVSGVEMAVKVGRELADIEWPSTTDIDVPTVRVEGVPYAGGDEVHLLLQQQTSQRWQDMPA